MLILIQLVGTGTSFLFFSGQIQGALLLLLSGVFETIWELPDEAKAKAVSKNQCFLQKNTTPNQIFFPKISNPQF